MCGDTLFEVTAQTSAIFFVIFNDGSGNTVHQIGWLTCAIRLKTRRGRPLRGPRSRLQRWT